MRSLAIDTSSNLLSLALADNETIVHSTAVYMERGQGEALIPLIQSACKAIKWDIASIDEVIVAVGPGSFTGVRIALAAARGIALSLNIPVKGITNFETLVPENTAYPVCVALDTKRGDFYTQIYHNPEDTLSQPQIMTREEIGALNMTIVTDKPDVFSADIHTRIGATPTCPAENMIRIAHQYPAKMLPPEPVYLREADVTVVTKAK